MPSPTPNLPVWARVANAPFIAGIWLYRFTLSPFIGRYCRFSPTCSQYGLEAYRTYGPWRATRLTAWRLARCQPLAKGGYDPVPLPAGRADEGAYGGTVDGRPGGPTGSA